MCGGICDAAVRESERKFEKKVRQDVKDTHLDNLSLHVIKMGTLFVFAAFKSGRERSGDGRDDGGAPRRRPVVLLISNSSESLFRNSLCYQGSESALEIGVELILS